MREIRQKIKMTGLSNGKAYVFSVYSQAWEASGREAVLSCSELSDGSDYPAKLYGGASQDGWLVECTYLADGTPANLPLTETSNSTSGTSMASATERQYLGTPNLAGNDNVGDNRHMVTIEDGYFNYYLDGSVVGSANFGTSPVLKPYPTSQLVEIPGAGPDGTVDEATFSTVDRSAEWISASYNNQKPSSAYLNFETLVGPPSLDDAPLTTLYGKKDTALSYSVAYSGSGSFSATGLPPGLSINSATGVISGSTSVTGTQNFTVTATGATAGGGSVSVSLVYVVAISDPTSFPFRMDLTPSGYTGSSTLTDFPVLVSLSSSITGFSYNGFLDPDEDGVRTGSDLALL